jgi:hypothetical protein
LHRQKVTVPVPVKVVVNQPSPAPFTVRCWTPFPVASMYA